MESSQAKEFVSALREYSMSYRNYYSALKGVSDTAKPLKRLIGEPDVEAKAKGSRLIAAGIALIAFPDPTITDLIGAGLVAAGLIKNRMQQPTVADVCKELRKATTQLENLRRGLTINRRM